MDFYLVDVKSVEVVNGKSVPLDYINTYTSFHAASNEAMRLSMKSGVVSVSLHRWTLNEDGSVNHTDWCCDGKEIMRSDNAQYFDTDSLVQKGNEARDILASNISDDSKLFEVFKLYSEYLKITNSALYYALLGWKDAHLKQLLKEQANDVELKLNDLIDSSGPNITMTYQTCKECNGTGMIPLGPGIRGIRKCPICYGIGHVNAIKHISDDM